MSTDHHISTSSSTSSSQSNPQAKVIYAPPSADKCCVEGKQLLVRAIIGQQREMLPFELNMGENENENENEMDEM
ncbi:hypothetical protein BLOT_012752 [Blomia tropicalis]|nr:hypothetical protein BLOT_012752 [Blomia tropicalis]